jgi:adenosylhomocysteine nucleosidase
MRKDPLAIVAAMDEEVRIVRSRMSVDSRHHVRPALFTRGMYGRFQIVLARSGIGRDAMRSAMGHLLTTFHPSLCLHVGYCGAAIPSLAAGDLVVAEAVLDTQSGERFEAPADLVSRASRIIHGRGLRSQSGAIATVDKLISSPHDKAFMGTRHGAIAIDMESCAFAAACIEGGAPHLVVRAVLDPMDCEFPKFDDVLDESGSTDEMALAGHLMRHPADALKLPQLEYLASQARNSIASFIDAWGEAEGT